MGIFKKDKIFRILFVIFVLKNVSSLEGTNMANGGRKACTFTKRWRSLKKNTITYTNLLVLWTFCFLSIDRGFQETFNVSRFCVSCVCFFFSMLVYSFWWPFHHLLKEQSSFLIFLICAIHTGTSFSAYLYLCLTSDS